MVKTKKILFSALALAVLLAGGCQKDEKSSGKAEIYYSAIESGDYYEGWANNLKGQAEKEGYGFEVGYAENSVEAQVAQIKDALKDGSSVFLCGLVSPDITAEVKAAAGSAPIVFINNAPPDSQLEKDRCVYVASNEFMAGQYQAEYILEKFAGKEEINVMLLKGPKSASGTSGRTQGLKQTLEAGGKKINYVFEDNADWSEETAKDLTGIFLKTGIQVDCVAANNDDMALGAVAAFEEAGMKKDDVLFLGVDASEKGCEAIANGKMDFTVYQPMSSQIEAAVKAAGNMAMGKGIEGIDGAQADGKYILLPFEKVDASNVGQYQ